jgi:ligand-binding sensor domain-containing protein
MFNLSVHDKLIAFFLLLNSSSLSQVVEPQFDYLPIGMPMCVLHDSRGFIWIGGQVGLYRYDGYELKYYSRVPFDSTSLSTNWVMTIKEDFQGNLWIGTNGGGLNYFDQRTETFAAICMIRKN